MKCKVKRCPFEVEEVREMIIHSRDEHETVLEPCHEEGCEGKVFTTDQLRIHNRSVHIGITTCPFPSCLKQFESLILVTSHIYQKHRLETGLHESTAGFSESQEEDEIGVLEKNRQLGSPTPEEDLLNNGHFLIYYLTADMHPGFCFQYLTQKNLEVIEDLPETKFYIDKQLPLKQVTPRGIKSTGQDSGHLAPRAKYRFSTEAYKSTFSMRNVVPMIKHINNGLWRAIDEHFTAMVRNGFQISSYVGPIYEEGFKVVAVLGGYNIPIPMGFFHVNLCERRGEPAFTHNFVLPNTMQETRGTIWSYQKSLEEANRLSGYDFFSLQSDRAKIASYDIGRDPFICTINSCHKTFLSQPQLSEHQPTHDNSYQCGKCSTIWPSRAEYLICMESHRNLKCSFAGCNKTFITQFKLTEHLRTHTGEKPFICDFSNCGQSFACSAGLIKHKKIHIANRPYICLRCNADFKRVDSLYRHVRRVEGEEPNERNTQVPHKRMRFN